MDQMGIDAVHAWLFHWAEQPPPPAFELAHPADNRRGLMQTYYALRAWDAEMGEPHDRSGAIGFTVQDPEWEGVHASSLSPLVDACHALDEREFEIAVSEAPEQAWVSTHELTSRVEGLPVIGPGGGARLVAERWGWSGELLVRRRTAAHEGRWARLDAIAAELRALPFDDLEVWADLGYFEVSRRERQRLLRPAVTLLIERRADAERGSVGWRRFVVEPATQLDGVPPDAGLDLWYEPIAGGADV